MFRRFIGRRPMNLSPVGRTRTTASPPKGNTVSAHAIAMLGLKGGVGRTTVALWLASALARRKLKVVVVDADPQALATTWCRTHPVDGVTVVPLEAGRDLATTVQDLGPTCDVVLVDCPPAPEATSERAAGCADLVLAPIPPGGPEVWATPRLIALVARARAENPGLRFAGVINRLTQTRLATKYLLKLIEMDGLPRLRTSLGCRVAYTDPRSIARLRDAHALQEIDALATEVLQLLGRLPPTEEEPWTIRGFSRWKRRGP